MTCQTAEISIQKSLDGMLPQTERQALDIHLESCAACRREWDAQRRLARLSDRWISRSLAQSDPGEAFTAQVLARLETGPKPSRLSLWLPLTATLLLLTALAFVPGLPTAGAGTLVRSLHGLPLWLGANLSALPGDALAMLRLPQTRVVPSWTGALLAAAIALNSMFCLYARQSALRRSMT